MKSFKFFTVSLIISATSTFTFAQVSNGSGGLIVPNSPATNVNVGIGVTNPSGGLHLLTGSNPGMILPSIILERNDLTNQAGILTMGISSNGFASPLGGGSAYFKLDDPFGNSQNSDMGFSTNALAPQLVIKHNGFVGIGTSTPTAQLEVNGIPSSTPTGIIGNGISTGVFGQATNMNLALTEEGIASGWSEAIGVFGKGTYASTLGNGNIYGVAGSASGSNPLNNIGVFGEARNASGYNTGMFGIVNTTIGIFNTGVAGSVVLNNTANWNKAVAGYAPVAPNHFAGHFEGKVAIIDGSQSSNYVLTSDANGLATWTDPCTLPCISGSSNYWHINGNLANPGEYVGTNNSTPLQFAVNSIPSVTLDNGGNLSVSTAGISTYQKLYVETNKQNDGIQVNQTGTTAATLDLNASGGAGKRWALLSTGTGNNEGAGHLLFWDWTTNQEQMRIDVNGNIVMGVGLNTPAGYKLYVEEGILTEKVKVAIKTSLAWADYVFADDYSLKSLSEVEKFIQTNKHLPNVPSAQELVNNGLDLGTMQAIQMEKIEELTLYLIQMQKEIDLLKAENSALKVQESSSKN